MVEYLIDRVGLPGWLAWTAAAALAAATRTIASCRASYGRRAGQPHCTASGVSPQPTPRRPSRVRTSTTTRAHVTASTTCAPNLSGTRVRTGSRKRAAPVTRMSVENGTGSHPSKHVVTRHSARRHSPADEARRRESDPYPRIIEQMSLLLE